MSFRQRLYEALNRLTKQKTPFLSPAETNFVPGVSEFKHTYYHWKSITLIICGTKLLYDGKTAYDCLRYLGPIHYNWAVIKYDPETRARAEKMFKVGKVSITLDQCLKNWAILERNYYDVDTLFVAESGTETDTKGVNGGGNVVPKIKSFEDEIPSSKKTSSNILNFFIACLLGGSSFEFYKRRVKVSVLETTVKLFLLFSKINYHFYLQGWHTWIDKKQPQFFKQSSTLSEEIYPPYGWYINISQDGKVDDAFVRKNFINDFEDRLKYEYETGELKPYKRGAWYEVSGDFKKFKNFLFNEL